MTDTLALAAQLREFDDARLRALITERGVTPAGIADFFDLAEALLEPASIQTQLSRLDRHTLATLVAAGGLAGRPTRIGDLVEWLQQHGSRLEHAAIAERLAVAASLALVSDADGLISPYEAVTKQLASWAGDGDDLVASPPPALLDVVADLEALTTDRLAAERGFTVVAAMSELTTELTREPARELAKGGLALPDSKRLATTMSVELDEVPALMAIAKRAELVARADGRWSTSETGDAWTRLSTASRWAELAESWRRTLPRDVLEVLRERQHSSWGDGLRAYVGWLYPAGGRWIDDRIVSYTRDAELLGITAGGVPSSAGAALVSEGADAAAAVAAGLFPPEVQKVYLQHDLSVVSPGPLEPALDARLRMLADPESRGLAATYRISASSVNRALAIGETAASIREFLTELSLTGIPQPLDYLIGEAAERYGRVRVGRLVSTDPSAADAWAQSYVRSDDGELLRTIEVDQSLSSLSLRRTGVHRLVSRFEPDIVFWALSDARYPVAAEDHDGQTVSLARRSAVRRVVAASVDRTGTLIERLRLAVQSSPELTSEAWLARQLDVAIRAKVELVVSVLMPGGATVEYLLEPTSVAGGRLRARDRRADIERTLPLASISSITPAGARS
ncbi:helicase-associated domain-containing protein [Compostimonas suwonensis]|uniref:XPB/Ssl2-like helicase family protein n=1 Tax=Compostimonas suwonensis TaxID=1048394 RepID=A0A2M9BVK1_9MICO|nr:helicase-associated domain-containing protein [Compostimonas suwonensis]PJJ61978.1 XPB/Ssl2-like helicase family protein [Compostimonas suwonensis]